MYTIMPISYLSFAESSKHLAKRIRMVRIAMSWDCALVPLQQLL